jgi:hypothetical protein
MACVILPKEGLPVLHHPELHDELVSPEIAFIADVDGVLERQD